jgi:hypothetical protein
MRTPAPARSRARCTHERPDTGLWALLIGPLTEFGFMRRALAGCLALSLSCAPVGVFLLLRRMSLTGDAMAHAILPGAAIGYLLAGLSLPAMTVGGIVAGLLVAVARGWWRAPPCCAKTPAWPRSTCCRWRWAC